MEIFDISENSGYEEIVSMGPKWWTEYKEMDAVYRYHGWLMDLKIHFVNRVIFNQFPGQADEETVKKFERMFKFEPEETDTLEDRRRLVAAYYSGTGKLSFSVIESIIRSYTGSKSDIWWEGQELNIRIYCEDEVSFSNRRVYQIIKRRFPAHLVFWIRNVLCTFELNERWNVPRIVYRSDLVWWEKALDGKKRLDGSVQLDAMFPPFFVYKLPYAIKNELKIQNTAFGMRNQIQQDFSSEISGGFRAIMNWWEELRTLDGDEFFDGLQLLDQNVSPYWERQTYRTEFESKEEITMSMYVPSRAKLLDGSVAFDGTINLNSGREEL